MPVHARTPLFPAPGETLIINQGQTGDCYLLAALDSLLKNKAANAHIQERFEELPDGSVRVRLKHCADSKNLAKNMKAGLMGGKYHYEYDEEADEDVFIISKEELARIDSDKHGVQTNSLAVKILEHLSPYYFNKAVAKNPFESAAASVMMHNESQRFNRHGAEFVGQLLGVDRLAVPKQPLARQLHLLRALKERDASHPVYVGIEYGSEDRFGNFHGRHAFRLEGFVPNDRGGYDVILANPWDNRKVERFSEEELHRRKVVLYTYDVSKLENPAARKDIRPTPAIPAAPVMRVAPVPVSKHAAVAPTPTPAVAPRVSVSPAPLGAVRMAHAVIPPKSLGVLQPRVDPSPMSPPLAARANLYRPAVQRLLENKKLGFLRDKAGFLLAGEKKEPSAVLGAMFDRLYIAFENFRTDKDLAKFRVQCLSVLEQALPPLDMRECIRIPKLEFFADTIVSVMKKLDDISAQIRMREALSNGREAQEKKGLEIDSSHYVIRPLE